MCHIIRWVRASLYHVATIYGKSKIRLEVATQQGKGAWNREMKKLRSGFWASLSFTITSVGFPTVKS